MFTRYFSAIASGTLMTLALLFVMQSLIYIQPGAASTPPIHVDLDFGSVREAIPPRPIEPPPVDLETLTKSLVPPHAPRPEGSSQSVGVRSNAPALPDISYTLTDFGAVDGPLVAIVRVQPEYPARARASGLEGYVVVQFDVMANGQVENAVVIESSHTVFEKTALKAARRFKFRPRVVGGVTLVSSGIQNIFRFEMETP